MACLTLVLLGCSVESESESAEGTGDPTNPHAASPAQETEAPGGRDPSGVPVSPTCTAECSAPDTRVCDGEHATRACVRTDVSSCLRLMPAVACPAEHSCLDGACRYTLLDKWQTLTTTGQAPGQRSYPSAVWTGTDVIVYGGWAPQGPRPIGTPPPPSLSDIYALDPVAKTWRKLVPVSGTPAPLAGHAAVWTGADMLVFGGNASHGWDIRGQLYRFNPTTLTWSTINAPNAPSPRSNVAAVWTGTEMLLFGGFTCSGDCSNSTNHNDGFRFDPVTSTWTKMSPTNAPSARNGHLAVWTGSEMLIFGGQNKSANLGQMHAYDPKTDQWREIVGSGSVPSPRADMAGAWTGTELVVFGGAPWGYATSYGDVFVFDLATRVWRKSSGAGSPSARWGSRATWVGAGMLGFGGVSVGTWFSDTYLFK